MREGVTVMDDKIQKILEAAVEAPSGDNCQPWKFAVEGFRIRIFNLPERDTSLYNFQQKASLAAHGALLENLTIAANHYGLETEFDAFPDSGNPNLVAEVHLRQTEPKPHPLYDAIFARTTNRKIFKAEPLAPEHKETLLQSADDVEGVRVHVAADRDDIEELAEALSVNDRLVFENRYLHRFLFDHLRWSEEEAQQSRDGLDIRGFELSGFDAAGFRLMKSWPVVNVLTKLGLGKKIQKQARDLCASASAIVAVTVPGGTQRDFLQGGRGMERVWLEATRQGLACHSISGIAYLIQRLKEDAAEKISARHQQMIREVFTTLQRRFDFKEEENLAMLFRVGYSDPPSARSLRTPPQELLVSEKQ